MARFYDTIDDSELARVEGFLRNGGIGYYLRVTPGPPLMKEIFVAEEDMAYAQELLSEGTLH